MKTQFEEMDNDEYTVENRLGQQIFRSFQEQNLNSWIALFPTADEFKNVLEQMLSANIDGISQQGIDQMLTHRESEADSLYAYDFNDLLKQAHCLEIDWKKSKYIRFDFLIAYPEKMKIRYLTGDLRFSCEGKSYEMKDIEALKIGAVYKLQAVKSIKESY